MNRQPKGRYPVNNNDLIQKARALLIGEGCTPWISFRNTIAGLSEALPRPSGARSFYEWGEKILLTTKSAT